MNYKTIVADMFTRLPKLPAAPDPDPYTAVGSILLPALESALAAANLGQILPICAFLEDTAIAAQHDNDLRILMQVEVGEWLGHAANEDRLTPWLGHETKRLCNYTPGLATQRRQLQAEQQANSLFARIKAALRLK